MKPRDKMPKGWRCALCGWINAGGGSVCASCDKKKPRARSPRAAPRPSFRAWDCIVLALDPANTTGWAIWIRGKYHASGEFEIFTGDGVRECVRVVDIARDLSLSLQIPWVAMAERSFGGHMGTSETSALGFWRFALLNAQLLPGRVGLVYPSQWRARILGRGMGSKPREEIRPIEQAHARTTTSKKTIGEDEAPAVCVGEWAAKAGETALLLPPTLRVTI